MTERAKKLEDFKTVIRAYLLPLQNGIPLRRLKHDYYEFIGSVIPYRELGFSNEAELLYSIPDAVSVEHVGGELHVFAVCNEQTAHVADLVSRQKNQSVRNKGNKRMFGSRNRMPRYAPPRLSNYNPANRMIINHLNLPKCVPPRIKNDIQNLLHTFPDGLFLENFPTAYLKSYGIELRPRDFDYNTWYDFARSLASENIVQIEETSNSVLLLLPHHLRPHYNRQGGASFPNHAQNKSTASFKEETDCSNREASANETDWNNDVVINDHILDNLTKVIEEFPSGLPMTELLESYQKITGSSLNLMELGYHNVQELVSDTDDIFTVKVQPGGEWMLLDARLSPNPEESNTHSNKEEGQQMEIPEDFQQNIYDLLRSSPDGILLSDFEEVYKMNYQEHIPWQNWKYQSLESFFMALEFNPPIRFTRCGLHDLKVVLTPKESMLDDKHHFSVTQSGVPTIPEDAVLLGHVYTPMKVPQDEHDYFSVCVSVVESPGKLWLQMVSDTECKNVELDDLMDNLEEFYQSPEADNYKIPDKYLVSSMNCAVIYPEDQNWHRGCIIGKTGPTSYEIFYYDYGSICVVDKELLRLLKKSFAVLPAQAFCARLANVKPLAEFYSPEATSRLLDLCKLKALMAQITSRKYLNTLSVILCDTSCEEDIFFNDLLVSEGLVKVCKDIVELRRPHSIDNSDTAYINPQNTGNVASQDTDLFQPSTVYKPSLFDASLTETSSSMRGIGQPVPLQTTSSSTLTMFSQPAPQNISSVFSLPGSQFYHPPILNDHKPEDESSTVIDSEIIKRIQERTSHKKKLNFSPRDVPQATVEPIQFASEKYSEPEVLVPLTPARDHMEGFPHHTPNQEMYSTQQQQDDTYESSKEDDEAEIDSLEASGPAKHNCKPLRFCKRMTFREVSHCAHLINFFGQPCFTSADLSSFVFGVDIIKRILHIRKYPSCHIMASREDHPTLFEELENLCATGFTSEDARTEKVVLYTLSDTLKILSFLNHNKQALQDDILECMKYFNPQDSYWMTREEVDIGEVLEDRNDLISKMRDIKQEIMTLLRSMMDKEFVKVSEADHLLSLAQETETIQTKLAKLDQPTAKSASEQAREFLERLKLNTNTETNTNEPTSLTPSPLEVVTASPAVAAPVQSVHKIENVFQPDRILPVSTGHSSSLCVVSRPPIVGQGLNQVIPQAAPYNHMLPPNYNQFYHIPFAAGFNSTLYPPNMMQWQ